MRGTVQPPGLKLKFTSPNLYTAILGVSVGLKVVSAKGLLVLASKKIN